MRAFRRKFEDCNDKLADIIRDGETTRSGRLSHDYVYAKDIQDKQTNGPYKLTKNADILKYDYLNYHRKNELWHDNDESVSVSMNSATKENLIKQIMLTNSDISTHKLTKKPRKLIIRKRNEQQHDEQQHDNYPRKRQKTKADTSKILAGVVNRRRAATLKEQEEAAREEESQKMREELHDAQLQIRAERDVADALRASIDPAQEEDSDNQDEDPASEDSEDGSRGRREVGHRKPRPKIVADDESPPPSPSASDAEPLNYPLVEDLELAAGRAAMRRLTEFPLNVSANSTIDRYLRKWAIACPHDFKNDEGVLVDLLDHLRKAVMGYAQ
jgi:hypothetical protein